MSIQKKSLIGNLAAAKKAIVATNAVSVNSVVTQPVQAQPGLETAKKFHGLETAKKFRGLETAKKFRGLETAKKFRGIK